MKKFFRNIANLLFASFCCLQAALAQDTAFTYQGRLNDANAPAAGFYDLRFAIFDDANAGMQLGSSLTNSATAVSNGLFTVLLDFGGQFSGASRWLEIGVRTNGSGMFTLLSPRQPMTPTPYAIRAATAGSVAATNISGSIASAQTVTGSQSNMIAAAVTNIVVTTANGLTNYVRIAGNVAAIAIGAGNSSALTASGQTAAFVTNFVVYPTTLLTNPVYFQGATLHPSVNNYFWWNSAGAAYTNTLGLYLFYSPAFNGWMVGLTNKFDGVGNNLLYDDQGGSGSDISQILQTQGTGIWADYTTSIEESSMFLSGIQTNVQTNTYLIVPVTAQFNLTTNLENFITANDSTSRTLMRLVYVSNSMESFVAPVYSTETNVGYVPEAQDGSGGAGLYAYFMNLENTQMLASDKRFSVGVATVFGTNGQFGALIEFLPLRDSLINDSPQQAHTLFWHPLKLTGDGTVVEGNNPTSEHTLDFKFTNAWNVQRSSTASRPQMYFEPSPAPTNSVMNGQIYNDTNRLMVAQNGVWFSIPQINTTNATLSAATSFAWKFSHPFSDTNYSVTVSGMGDTLGLPQIGTKTTTNVIITFSPFTGTLNAIAALQ